MGPSFIDHLSSHPVFTGIRIAQSVVICAMFCRSFFVLFLLAIALSVLRFTAPCYHFGIFFFLDTRIESQNPKRKYFEEN